MNLKTLVILFSILFSTGISTSVKAKKLEILLLSGANNHNWKETTPALQEIFEKSDYFNVTITEQPETIHFKQLKKYDAVVSNWNRFPEQDYQWPEKTQNDFMRYIKSGGGILFLHAATSINYDIEAFQNLSGATWKNGTRHGKQSTFEVKMKDSNHPITKGVSNFWITDELWVNIYNYQTSNVLAEAFSSKSNRGRDMMEPVLFEQELEKGRSVYLVLGHDKKVMQNEGFQTLLLRGTEWAAKGKVKQEVPSSLSASKNNSSEYQWKLEKENMVLLKGKEIIYQLNFKKDEGKPYIHPLKTTEGTELTWMRPIDHPWHRALWFSWKFINGINYWEEDRATGKSDGQTEIQKVSCKKLDNGGAQCIMDLIYHPGNSEVVLKEKRVLTFSSPDKNGDYIIDWDSDFIAMGDSVILDRTPLENEPGGKRWGGYAGFSIRMNKNLWNQSAFNDEGDSENLHGTKSKWMTYQLKNIKGIDVSLTIFDHPRNPNHPNSWYVEESTQYPFYFFSPCPLFNAKQVLLKNEKLSLSYRLLVSSEKRNEQLIQSTWNNFKTK